MAKKAIILLFLLVLTSGCSSYYRFDELYDKGKFMDAYRVLEEISKRDNSHYQQRIYRVVIRLALDGDTDFIEKLRSLPATYSLPQVSDYIRFSRSYILFLRAKTPAEYRDVISNLDTVRTVPEEFQSHLFKVRGIALYKTGKYRDAIQDILKSYKLAPYIDNLYYLGMCQYYLKDTMQAASYFNRVISASQSDFFKSLAYYQLGEIDYGRAKYPAALEQYIHAMNVFSQNADYHYKIAKCLQRMKYGKAAQKFLKIALRTQKDYANAWFFLNIN